MISNDAESWYDGLELEWAKRCPGLQFQAAYTYSHRTRRRKRRSSAPATRTRRGPNAALRAGRIALPHAASVHVQRQLPPAVLRGQHGLPRSGVRRLAGCRASSSWLRHAVHGHDHRRRPRLRRVRRGPSRAGRPVGLGAHVDDRDTSQTMLRAERSARDIRRQAGRSPRRATRSTAMDVKNVDMALSKVFRMPWRGDRPLGAT